MKFVCLLIFFREDAGLEAFEYLNTEDKVQVLLSLGLDKQDIEDVPECEYLSLLERSI